MEFQPPYVISPKSLHTHTIILLHGRDNNGEDFAEELFSGRTSQGSSLIERTSLSGTKWIFPSAHARMSSLFQEELDEWFDIHSLSDPSAKEHLQVDGLRESIQYIRGIVEEEIAQGLPARNIVLGGISQGFATAIHALLAGKHQLGGFVGFSGWMPFSQHFANLKQCAPVFETLHHLYSHRLETSAGTTAATLRTPVFVTHSCDDTTVEIDLGREATKTLCALGMDVQWNEYPSGEHWLCEPKAYDDLACYLDSVLAPRKVVSLNYGNSSINAHDHGPVVSA